MPLGKFISAGIKAAKAAKKDDVSIPSLNRIQPELARTVNVKGPGEAMPAQPEKSSTKGRGDANMLADQFGGMVGGAAKKLRDRSKM